MPERDPLDTGTWTHKTLAMRSKLNISTKYAPWTDSHACAGAPETERVRYLLDISWASRDRKCRKPPWYSDCSQCVSRQPWSTEFLCLTTSSIIFDHSQEKVLSATQKLAAHGFPTAELVKPTNVSEPQLHEMVGESMCVPNVGCILMAFFLNPHAPWWGHSA